MNLLGIRPTAWSVLYGLQDYNDWKGYEFSAWYNGRECSICMHKTLGKNKTLCIVFGEPRRTDGVFVDSWICVLNNFMNPPTLKDYTEQAYEDRHWFTTIDGAITHILGLAKQNSE